MKTFSLVVLLFSISLEFLPSMGLAQEQDSVSIRDYYCDFSGRPCGNSPPNHGCGPNEYYHCDFSGKPCICRPK